MSDVENSADTGNTPDSTSATDTGATAASATADTPATATHSEGTSVDAGSTPVETQVVPDAQANAESVETTNPQAQATADDEKLYKERFIGAQKSWQQQRDETNRLKEQLAQLTEKLTGFERQYQGVNPQDVQAYRTAQEVPVWDPSHKDHAEFVKLVEKADAYDEMIRGEENPEFVQLLRTKQQQAIGEKGMQTLRNWQADVRRQNAKLRLNPAAFYRDLIRNEAQPVIQESLANVSQRYQTVESARSQAQKWIKDNPDIATQENREAIAKLLEKGYKFDQAALQIERDFYKSRMSDATRKERSAEEKERLLSGNAAAPIARNPQSSRKVDYKQVAKDRGINNERDRIDLILELDHQGRL